MSKEIHKKMENRQTDWDIHTLTWFAASRTSVKWRQYAFCLHSHILPSSHCLLSACWPNQFPDSTFPVSSLFFQLNFSLLLSDSHPLLPDFSLSNTQRWPLNKRLCLVSTLLSTTLMIPVFRTAPRRRTNFTFLPLALSPHFTPFLMHSSNPSESYHAALPCSLNKSSFFYPLPPLHPPSFLLHPRLFPPLSSPISCLSCLSDASRTISSPIYNYLMEH